VKRFSCSSPIGGAVPYRSNQSTHTSSIYAPSMIAIALCYWCFFLTRNRPEMGVGGKCSF